jgi:hypothetical protein
MHESSGGRRRPAGHGVNGNRDWPLSDAVCLPPLSRQIEHARCGVGRALDLAKKPHHLQQLQPRRAEQASAPPQSGSKRAALRKPPPVGLRLLATAFAADRAGPMRGGTSLGLGEEDSSPPATPNPPRGASVRPSPKRQHLSAIALAKEEAGRTPKFRPLPPSKAARIAALQRETEVFCPAVSCQPRTIRQDRSSAPSAM